MFLIGAYYFRLTAVHMPKGPALTIIIIYPSSSHPLKGVALSEIVTDRTFSRRNTDHAWTDVPPPATFTVRCSWSVRCSWPFCVFFHFYGGGEVLSGFPKEINTSREHVRSVGRRK